MVGSVKGRVGGRLVPDLPVVADVAGGLVEDQRRPVGFGGLDRRHRRKLLALHIDQVGGRLGLLLRLRHHDRDAVTHVADLVQGESRMRRFDHGRAILAVDQPPRRNAAHAFHVLAGEDRVDAGCRLRGVGMDRPDLRMRHARPEDVAVQLPRQVDVVGVAAPSGQEALVFLPLDGGSDSRAVRTHDAPPMARAPARTALTMLW